MKLWWELWNHLPPLMFHFKQGSLGKIYNMSKYVKNQCERTELFIKGKN